MSERVTVRVRDCACPDTPHPDGDEVYLLPALSLEGGAAAEFDLLDNQPAEDATPADARKVTLALLAAWTKTYVQYGAVGWNWLRPNEQGKAEPIPFDVDVLLADYSLSRLVAERANALYSEAVMGPLVAAAQAASPNRQSRRSRTTRTTGSTSRRRAPTSKPPASSSPPDSDGPQLRAVR